MKTLLLAAALAVGLCLPVSAYAQAPETVPEITIIPVQCQFILDEVIVQIEANGVKFMVLDEATRALFLAAMEASLKVPVVGVTNVLIALVDEVLMFGLEVDGCLLGPEPVAKYLPHDMLSGLTPIGIFA